MDPTRDQIKSKEEEEEEEEEEPEGDEDREQELEGPSVLRLMVDKHEAIEQTVSLIKQELANEIIPDLVPEQTGASCSSVGAGGGGGATSCRSVSIERKFDGLTSLLDDSKIKSAIKDVAGNDTHELLDRALVALKSSDSIDGKNKVFIDGIKKLHANLVQSDKSKLQKDPLFSLAINLVGLRPNKHNN